MKSAYIKCCDLLFTQLYLCQCLCHLGTMHLNDYNPSCEFFSTLLGGCAQKTSRGRHFNKMPKPRQSAPFDVRSRDSTSGSHVLALYLTLNPHTLKRLLIFNDLHPQCCSLSHFLDLKTIADPKLVNRKLYSLF